MTGLQPNQTPDRGMWWGHNNVGYTACAHICAVDQDAWLEGRPTLQHFGVQKQTCWLLKLSKTKCRHTDSCFPGLSGVD